MFCKKFIHQRKGTAGTTVPFLWFIFRQKVEVGCYAGFTLRTYPFAHTSNPHAGQGSGDHWECDGEELVRGGLRKTHDTACLECLVCKLDNMEKGLATHVA